MIRPTINSALFGGFDLATAFAETAAAGAVGIELCANAHLAGHFLPHTQPDAVREAARLASVHGVRILSVEQFTDERRLMRRTLEAAAVLGAPAVSYHPKGSRPDDEASFAACAAFLREMHAEGSRLGVRLCLRAHLGECVWNTPTTLRMLAAVPGLALDFDPSHLHRAGEAVPVALRAVWPHLFQAHLRDCTGRQRHPGAPTDQICGRGEIALDTYLRDLAARSQDTAVILEIIGARDAPLETCRQIARESLAWINRHRV